MKQIIIFCVLVLVFSSFASAMMTEYDKGKDNELEYVGYDVEVSLNKGWNLLASGLIFEKGLNGILESSEIKAQNVKAVYVYSNKINEFISNYPVYDERLYSPTEYFYGDELDMIGMGNWIYVDKAGTLKYKTKAIKKINSINLFRGWNFLSITPEYNGFSLDEIKGDCEIESAYSFDVTAQKWTSFLLSQQTFSEYDEGRSILIKVTDDCNLKGYNKNSVETVPSLPESYGTKCIDSDNGKEYYTKGIITRGSEKFEDGCNINGAFGSNPNIMREYFCDEEGKMESEWYDCPNGCSDGACI